MTVEARVLGFIESRLESMLRAPGLWGSDESVELQVLQLLELRLVVLAPLPEPGRDRRVQDDYERYVAGLFPGDPPETLSSLLAARGRQGELPDLLRRFVEQQMLRPVARVDADVARRRLNAGDLARTRGLRWPAASKGIGDPGDEPVARPVDLSPALSWVR